MAGERWPSAARAARGHDAFAQGDLENARRRATLQRMAAARLSPLGSRAVGAAAADAAARRFAAAAALFVGTAIVVAIVHAITPVTRGWWLVAYLTLVGGTSQLLLGSGLTALAHRAGAPAPSPVASTSQFALWNVGTIVVAAADLVDAPAGVLAGSVVLLAALALFAADWRRIHATERHPALRWHVAYVLLLAGLAVSTFIGTGLADALPGQ
jgi:hypothetical protein